MGAGGGGRGEIRSVLGEDVDEMGDHVALPRVGGHHGFNHRVRKRTPPRTAVGPKALVCKACVNHLVHPFRSTHPPPSPGMTATPEPS